MARVADVKYALRYGIGMARAAAHSAGAGGMREFSPLRRARGVFCP
ncbi:hypothetical protein [Litorivita sp. NS0012-18]